MMSARVLLNGVLEKPPVRLTSKAGKWYLRASARDGKGPDAKWWTVFAFAEATIEALEVLVEGEAFAATGTFDATIWAPEGREPRVNLTHGRGHNLVGTQAAEGEAGEQGPQAKRGQGSRSRRGGTVCRRTAPRT